MCVADYQLGIHFVTVCHVSNDAASAAAEMPSDRHRIMYKLCTIIYNCVHGAAPSYLTEMCIPIAASTGRRFLRSASHGDLIVPWARTSTYGQRSFAVSRPSIWNDLPPTLRAS